MMFSGLRSRWTMPAACACARPSAIWWAIGASRRGDSRRRPQVAQGFALHPFHGDERHAGLIANVMDGEDIGMVQGGSRLGFLLEAMQTIAIVGETGWEDSDRDRAIEAGITRAVTSPMPPAPIGPRISYGPSVVPDGRLTGRPSSKSRRASRVQW